MPGWLDKILGFFPDFLGLGAGIFGGVNNAQLQRETNETNMAIAKMTNAAQAREHEKAYERSKATNQVNLLQQAGMSKAGALQTLNGGGSYQPAPMQSSQAQAPQLDLSAVTNGLLQIGENARQRKAADELQEKQLRAAKEQQKAQLDFEREKLDFEKQKYDDAKGLRDVTLEKLGFERDIARIDKEIADVVKDGRVNAEQAENLSRQSQAILDDIRSKRVTEAMSRMTDEELDNLFDLQATLNMLQQGLQYDSTSVILKAAKKIGNFIGGAKGAGRMIRTH